jgi:hypothetical protein
MMFVFRHLPENQDSAVGDLPLALLATVSEPRVLTEEIEKSNQITSFMTGMALVLLFALREE